MHGFLDSHIWHNLLASDLIFYKPEEMVVKRDLGPNRNVDGFKVSNYPSESSPSTASCVGLCTVMLQNTCHTVHDKASGASESNKQH